MRRAMQHMMAVAAVLLSVGCQLGGSPDPFCDAVADWTRSSASAFALVGSDNPSADAKGKRQEILEALDRMEEHAPNEIAPDVRQVAAGWRAFLNGQVPRPPSDSGSRAETWATQHCAR